MTRLLLLLPERPHANVAAAWWWRVDHGAVVASGGDDAWVRQASEPGTEVIGLAPAAAVRLVITSAQGETDRQAAAVAAASAREASLAEADTLHAVAVVQGEGETRRALTALVAAEAMEQWLGWARAFGIELRAIVPSLLLLPDTEEWTDLRLGTEHLVGRGELRFPYEPALADALIGEAGVRQVSGEELENALVRLAEAPPLDLRQGRFGARTSWRMEPRRLRELLLLAACIPLLALLAALVTIVRLDRDSARLDRETAEVASAALGRPVTAEAALAELNVQAARTGGAGGSLSAPLAALYQQMQSEPSVTATALGWRGDGTLSTTLAATRPEDINRLLLGLQRNGYKVTAVPRTGTDGRQLADITVRSGA